jgi:uncharacterized Zn ribbon protein
MAPISTIVNAVPDCSDINCKGDGIGAMELKSESVKKA